MARVLLALTGYGTPHLADRLAAGTEPLLHYAGLFALRPRSADRLGALVSDWLGMHVEVVEFAGAWLPLPPDQRTRLSAHGAWCRLGVDAAAGVRAWDPQARIVLRIGPLDLKGFQRLLPDRVALHRLVSLVRAYVGFELGFAINPVLAAREVPPLRLDATVGSAAAAGLEHLGSGAGRRRHHAHGCGRRGVRGRGDRGAAGGLARQGKHGMSGWGSGYVTDITYMTGYYRQQSPSLMALACLLGGVASPTAVAGRSGELSGARLRPGTWRADPGGEQSALDGHRHRLQSRRMSRRRGPGRRRPASTTSASSKPTCRPWPRTPRRRRCPRRTSSACTACGRWVPRAVQAGIVRLLRAKVKPGGAVHVSYNALPAWGGALGMQRLVRDGGRRLATRSDRQAEEGLKLVQDLQAADALQLKRSPMAIVADRAHRHHAGVLTWRTST